MEVRERIRINGKAISKAQFTAYFWEIYNKLESTKSEYNGSMPRPHTIFLNTMGLYVFLREKVENIAHNFTLTLQSCPNIYSVKGYVNTYDINFLRRYVFGSLCICVPL